MATNPDGWNRGSRRSLVLGAAIAAVTIVAAFATWFLNAGPEASADAEAIPPATRIENRDDGNETSARPLPAPADPVELPDSQPPSPAEQDSREPDARRDPGPVVTPVDLAMPAVLALHPQQGGAPDHVGSLIVQIRRDPRVALERLIELADEVRGDPAQEAQVAEALELLHHKLSSEDAGRVVDLYDSSSEEIQRSAALMLASSGDDRLKQRFLDDRRSSLAAPDPATRADAAASIARLGGDSAIEGLRSLLGDSSEEVVVSALNGLLLCRGNVAASDVRTLLEHSKRSVRSLAAAALERWDAEAREARRLTSR